MCLKINVYLHSTLLPTCKSVCVVFLCVHKPFCIYRCSLRHFYSTNNKKTTPSLIAHMKSFQHKESYDKSSNEIMASIDGKEAYCNTYYEDNKFHI